VAPSTAGSAVSRRPGRDEDIYHREDGSERIPPPWRVPLRHFIEATFGGWYEGSSPPSVTPTQPRLSRCHWTHRRLEVDHLGHEPAANDAGELSMQRALAGSEQQAPTL
jgi:hypothetical protein